jgi:hypothetical protein
MNLHRFLHLTKNHEFFSKIKEILHYQTLRENSVLRFGDAYLTGTGREWSKRTIQEFQEKWVTEVMKKKGLENLSEGDGGIQQDLVLPEGIEILPPTVKLVDAECASFRADVDMHEQSTDSDLARYLCSNQQRFRRDCLLAKRVRNRRAQGNPNIH